MDFFAQQDRARAKTGWLVFFLGLAVVSLIAVTSLAVVAFIYFLQNGGDSYRVAQAVNTSTMDHFRSLLTPRLVGTVAASVLIVVASASLFKLMQLNRGGKEVALALGGRLINTDTRDPDERKVLNVVEEMAIASGNPVPNVYLLDEPGINAFAAGFGRRDAVIGVTRGCIEQLNRDELQGVIAHEFSHIHFGDMNLNMRLVALLHGVLIIGLLGYFILRSAGAGRRRNAGAQVALGLALVVIGYCGTFFGNVIKAAVSRQREFLADASAVQFTRNPSGIAGALKKIGGSQSGSRLGNSHASEYSHLYFAKGVSQALGSILATHPPLEQRIRSIEPGWDGGYIEPPPASDRTAPEPATPGRERKSAVAATIAAAAIGAADTAVGNPGPAQIGYAQDLLAELPEDIKRAAHEPYSARALVYALLLDDTTETRQQQLEHLESKAHPASFRVLEKLYEQVKRLPRTQHLPLLELCIPALKQLSVPQYELFKANLVALIRADRKISLFEWSLYRSLTHSVEEKRPHHRTHLRHESANCQLLLSLVCHSGGNGDASQAYRAGAKLLGLPDERGLLTRGQIKFDELDRALDTLAGVAPLEKPRLLKAIAACINSDERVTPEEAELFRAVADSLDCPVPPLLKP